jgi:hypothetical protein
MIHHNVELLLLVKNGMLESPYHEEIDGTGSTTKDFAHGVPRVQG